MIWDLKDKVVLITGAARGIGAETARKLAARGAKLSLVGMEPERLAALAQELGAGHVHFECDVTDQAALERAVQGTVAKLGGVDVVIANAGIANYGTVANSPVSALLRTLDVNLIGVVRTISVTMPHIVERRGYYLLIASAAAIGALPGMAAYASSKIAVEHFARGMRLEVKHLGVGVGVALPSWIDTDLVRDVHQELTALGETISKLPGPLGKTTSVDACATALVRAIEQRKSQVCIPGSLAILAAMRSLTWNRVMDWIIARQAQRMIPQLEAETQRTGRYFGKTSVGAGTKP